MKELNFSTGVNTYKLNGVCEVSFNPTDAEFVKRIYDTFDALQNKQDAIDSAQDMDLGEFFEFASAKDKEMREAIDGLFGAGVSEALFSKMNCYAMADGMPAWSNLFFMLFDEIDSVSDEETKKSDARIRKYTEKYRKKRNKHHK